MFSKLKEAVSETWSKLLHPLIQPHYIFEMS